MNFIIAHLEYIVAAAGVIGSAGYIILRKPRRPSNNLTRFEIRYKRQEDAINKQVKAFMR